MEAPKMNLFSFGRKKKEQLFFKVSDVENLDIGYKKLSQ